MMALSESSILQQPRSRFVSTTPDNCHDGEGAKRKPTGVRWPFLGALLLLAGYLLFCHGCHGDEDEDLFTTSSFLVEKSFAFPKSPG